MSLPKDPNYIAYCMLETRPKGMQPWGVNDQQQVKIGPGELFCRFGTVENGVMELCDTVKRFSHTGNLRNHVKGHLVPVASTRKGTLTAQEIRDAKKFYAGVMAAHKAGDAPYDPEVTLSYTPAIPVIAPLPHRSRPELPKKKDGTAHKAEMKKLAGVSGHCGACKAAKRKNCPADSTTDCEIWAFFTDDNEDNEERDEDQNEDRQQDEEMAENEQQDGEMDDGEQRDKVAEDGQRDEDMAEDGQGDEDMAEDGQVTEQRERVVSKGKGKKDKNGKNGKSKKGKSKGKKQ